MVHKVMEEMILYFQGDVRRINHALKVTAFAQLLGKLEGLPSQEQHILELAAVLHDIGIHEAEKKYNSTAGNYQEREGPPIAEAILKKCHVEEEIIPRVSFLVGHHHSYQKIDGSDFQILVEADFLVNIDEDSMKKEIVETVVKKYFKTAGGIRLAEAMYLECENKS